MFTIPERILPDRVRQVITPEMYLVRHVYDARTDSSRQSTAQCPKLNGFFSVVPPGTVAVCANRPSYQLLVNLQRPAAHDGDFKADDDGNNRLVLRFSCVANGVCLWRRRSLRFARHMTASLIASLLLRCKRRVPVAPSVPSLRSSHDGVAHCFASLRCDRRVPVAPSVPSLRSSQDGVAHCFASLALQTACACGAVGPFASLVTRRRRSLLRFSCVAYRVCLWRRRSLRFARHMTASLIASLLCVANGVCLWRRRSLRFARHMTASLIASLLSRCKRRVPVAPSVPSLRSSHDGVAHCFASRALQTACACGAVGPFASLVT